MKMVKDLVLTVAPNIPDWLKMKIRNLSIMLEHLPTFIQSHMALLGHSRIVKTKKQDTSKIMCFRCRWRGHKSKHCTSIPYCSLCQQLGHTNREHRAFVLKISTINQRVTLQEMMALEIELGNLSLHTSYATQQGQDRGQVDDKTGRAPAPPIICSNCRLDGHYANQSANQAFCMNCRKKGPRKQVLCQNPNKPIKS